jgi:hypothetical protein
MSVRCADVDGCDTVEVGRGLFFVCEKVVVGGDEERGSTSEIP